jgi:hypothetical protein
MGLSTTVYTGLKLIEGSTFDPDTGIIQVNGELFQPINPVVSPFINPYFPGRAEGITEGVYYYDYSWDFFNRGYGTYGNWRRRLAQKLNYTEWAKNSELHPAREGAPFYELIQFSDCEGTLGPKVCAKLSQDFDKMRDVICSRAELGAPGLTVDQILEEVHWFDDQVEIYDLWASALKIAANHNGMISFA